ncbi:hypothetical protein KIPB_006675, partial [Kipferlia bialata]|eukprot:g6675.t1
MDLTRPYVVSDNLADRYPYYEPDFADRDDIHNKNLAYGE